MSNMIPQVEDMLIDCKCLGCRATTIANKVIVLLLELDRLADEVTDGESDNVALMAAKEVAAVRDFIVEKFMEQETKHAC